MTRVKGMSLELDRVHGIVQRSRYLNRHSDLVDILLRQQRRTTCRDAIRQRRLMLAGVEAENSHVLTDMEPRMAQLA